MSLQYDEYLKEHIQNVTNGLRWIADNLDLKKLGIFESDISAALENAGEHDRSKYDVIEYRAYDDYFYGGNKSHAVKTAFDQAWLHHQHVNPHHWQYWVLINDDDGVNKALPMPEDYILEMIADWWSFSWREGNLMEIFDWYDKHRNVILFEEETRKTVEKILAEMRKVLEMQQKHENGYIGDVEDDHLENKKFPLHASTQVIGKVVDTRETENGIEVTVEHSEPEDDEDLYGVPELKKFPMPDKKHVKSAIRFFNYIDSKHEKELVKAILEKMDEYGMSFDDFGVGDENRFKKYIPEEDLKKNEEKSK